MRLTLDSNSLVPSDPLRHWSDPRWTSTAQTQRMQLNSSSRMGDLLAWTYHLAWQQAFWACQHSYSCTATSSGRTVPPWSCHTSSMSLRLRNTCRIQNYSLNQIKIFPSINLYLLTGLLLKIITHGLRLQTHLFLLHRPQLHFPLSWSQSLCCSSHQAVCHWSISPLLIAEKDEVSKGQECASTNRHELTHRNIVHSTLTIDRTGIIHR